MTDSLADRLRAAIDETARIAQAADFGPWEVGPTFGGKDNRVYVRREGDPIDTIGTCVIAGQVSNMPRFRANAQHIARHDPAAVLRRCAADRKILDLHRNDGGDCSTCRGEPEREVLWDGTDETWSWTSPPVEFPCGTARILAEAYGVEEQA